jgi:hypothetical protein
MRSKLSCHKPLAWLLTMHLACGVHMLSLSLISFPTPSRAITTTFSCIVVVLAPTPIANHHQQLERLWAGHQDQSDGCWPQHNSLLSSNTPIYRAWSRPRPDGGQPGSSPLVLLIVGFTLRQNLSIKCCLDADATNQGQGVVVTDLIETKGRGRRWENGTTCGLH